MPSSLQQLLTTNVVVHKYATFEGQTCCIIVDGSMLGDRSPRWPTTEPRLALPTKLLCIILQGDIHVCVTSQKTTLFDCDKM